MLLFIYFVKSIVYMMLRFIISEVNLLLDSSNFRFLAGLKKNLHLILKRYLNKAVRLLNRKIFCYWL